MSVTGEIASDSICEIQYIFKQIGSRLDIDERLSNPPRTGHSQIGSESMV